MKDIRRNVMNAVKINRLELLEIVLKNKEKHILAFDEAVNDYKIAALKIATENLDLVQSGELESIAKVKMMPAKPISYENSYTRAIRMLELSVDEVIEVEEDVFNQLVLDEWTWKNSFVANSSLYKSLNGSI
jgi:predicted nucleic acid-binding OB-fold protein